MAKQKLTKRLVETAAPTDKDYELRDTEIHGFLCKVTPAGNKIFMAQYRTLAGIRRKPKICLFGELTVEQAREIAKEWLGQVRGGLDPSASRVAARAAPSIVDFTKRFIDDYAVVRNKPRTVKDKQGYIDRHIVPVIGALKVSEVSRADITRVLARLVKAKRTSDLVLACLSKMFDMAEVWLLRAEGSNPCRLIKKYNVSSKTYCFTQETHGAGRTGCHGSCISRAWPTTYRTGRVSSFPQAQGSESSGSARQPQRCFRMRLSMLGLRPGGPSCTNSRPLRLLRLTRSRQLTRFPDGPPTGVPER